MTYHNDQQSLKQLKEGQTGIIKYVQRGKMVVKRLADMGLNPGTEIKLIRSSMFTGPVQIEVRGSRLGLGKGLISKTMIEIK